MLNCYLEKVNMENKMLKVNKKLSFYHQQKDTNVSKFLKTKDC